MSEIRKVQCDYCGKIEDQDREEGKWFLPKGWVINYEADGDLWLLKHACKQCREERDF